MMMMMSDAHHRLMPPLWGQGHRLFTSYVYVIRQAPRRLLREIVLGIDNERKYAVRARLSRLYTVCTREAS